MEWNTDHGVAIKNIVYDVQLPFVSVIGCLSRPGETLQYKGNRKGKVVQFQNLRLDTDCKRYGAEQTKPGIQFGGNQREGIKIETIHGEERIQHFIVPVLVWINRKRGQSTFLFWSILSHWFLCTFNTVPVLRSLSVLSGPCDTNYSVEIFRWGNWGHLY